MTAPSGFPRDMDRFALDTSTAERLLAGSVDAADAPPEYRGVATTLGALRGPPDSTELDDAPVAVERIVAAVVLARRDRPAPRSRRSRSRLVKLAAVAAVASALAITSGLAVAGALPESAQGAASTLLEKVGISIPAGDEQPPDHSVPATTAGPPPTTSDSVSSSPAPNGAKVPGPLPAGHPADGQGSLDGAGGGGAPPTTAKAGGIGPQPSGPPGQTDAHSHRP